MCTELKVNPVKPECEAPKNGNYQHLYISYLRAVIYLYMCSKFCYRCNEDMCTELKVNPVKPECGNPKNGYLFVNV